MKAQRVRPARGVRQVPVEERFTLRRLFLEVSLLALVAALAGTIGRSFGDWEVTVFLVQIGPLLLAWRCAKFFPSHYVGLLIAAAVFLLMLLMVGLDSTKSSSPLYYPAEIALAVSASVCYYIIGRAVAFSERWISDTWHQRS